MTIIEESVDIMQPANKVFAYITDIENLPKWESNAMEAEQTSQGSTGVGATRRGVDRVLGQKIPWTSRSPSMSLTRGVARWLLQRVRGWT
jgi:uncharacterized membrane protein